MKWVNNIKTMVEKQENDICPYCGSADTDFSIQMVDKQKEMGYADIWCNQCNHAFHISRMNVIEPIEKDIPSNLIY